MIKTIDKAGRPVIPAALRKHLGLLPGTQVELRLEGSSLRLVRAAQGPEVIRHKGRLVARPRAAVADRPAIDVFRLIEKERDRWPE